LRAAAHEAGISVLYGMEVDILMPPEGGRKGDPVRQAALLFARDAEGVRNLYRLASVAYAGWPGVEVPLPWETLAAHASGLVLILPGGDEAGALSPVATAPARKQGEWGKAVSKLFPGAAWVGLPHSGRAGDSALAAQVASAAGALGLPVVALPTARYLAPEDAPAYEALKAARRHAGWPREDADRVSTTSIAPDRPGFEYLRAPEDAATLFADWPEAVENVARVAAMCRLDDAAFAPSPHADGVDFLRGLAERGLAAVLDVTTLPSDQQAILDIELEFAHSAGTEASWVALTRIAEIARDPKIAGGAIPTGALGGPAGESLLAYALGLTPLPPRTPSHSAFRIPHLSLEVPYARDALVGALAAEYGAGRVAYAACPVEIMPLQAVSAAAGVLSAQGDDTKQIILSVMEKGWDALGSDGAEPVAKLARALKGAPLMFKPDPATVVAAPPQVAREHTAAEWGPLLRRGDAVWLPWAEQALCAGGYPVLTLRPTQALAVLDAGLGLARKYPVPGFAAESIRPDGMPALNEAARTILTKGELAGIPYLAAAATKGWEGDPIPSEAAVLLARSLISGKPVAPDPKPAAWEEVTAETGGALLFMDQLAALLQAFGLSVEDAEAARKVLVHPASDTEGEAKRRFTEACTAAGVEEAQIEATWGVLAKVVPRLVSRQAAAAWGRVALWSVVLKAAHPAAFVAGALQAAWERGGRTAVAGLADEARRLGVKLLAPHVNYSAAGATLQREGEGWAVLWGMSMLSGWHAGQAEQFAAARPRGGFGSMSEVALAAVDAGMQVEHMETLVRAGACDNLGGRQRDRNALLAVLPAMMQWAVQSRQASAQRDMFSASAAQPPVEQDLLEPPVFVSPRERYARREWEVASLGTAFTGAAEMDGLRDGLSRSGDLKARLLLTTQVGEKHLDSSIYLVGLLSSVRLLEGKSDAASNGKSKAESERMAVACLQDLEGSIELVAFPPGYRRHADLWVENNVVVVTARVARHPDGEIYLLCEHMAPFQAEEEAGMTVDVKTKKSAPKVEQPAPASPSPVPVPVAAAPAPAPQQASAPSYGGSSAPHRPPPSGDVPGYSLIVSIPHVPDDHTVIDSMISLHNLLAEHPGSDSVTIRVPYSPEHGRWTSARLPWGVSYNPQLDSRIRHLLGDDSLAVIKLLG
jgi:DNA polymerase III subunit alpha